MLKGCQKRIIVLKETGSPLFEEAYFILSERALGCHPSEKDMIGEANRIIRESGAAGHLPRGKRPPAVLILSIALAVVSSLLIIRLFI